MRDASVVVWSVAGPKERCFSLLVVGEVQRGHQSLVNGHKIVSVRPDLFGEGTQGRKEKFQWRTNSLKPKEKEGKLAKQHLKSLTIRHNCHRTPFK